VLAVGMALFIGGNIMKQVVLDRYYEEVWKKGLDFSIPYPEEATMWATVAKIGLGLTIAACVYLCHLKTRGEEHEKQVEER